ncbi:MAG: DNA repair and recombination protein RadA [Candidatus Bathyarchaeota archaeon]|nr:DNA repair and recombination protein RadA [Candidatus Bathyarchaeota archaeon]
MSEEDSPESKYVRIEDVPGVGSSTADKLRELGFHAIESLAIATVRELVKAGIGEKKAREIINSARAIKSPPFKRVDELIKERQSILRLTTGCKKIDELLGGGLETQSITEFYGEYGSGKSQLAHQLCINVQLPLEKGGLAGGALYIDTENTFRTERIIQMSRHLGLDLNEVFKGIMLAEAYTSDHQIFLLENADKVIKENNVRLIVVDSLTAHFRSEYIGRENLPERQQKLNQHMHKIIRLARAFNTVALVTNQVVSSPDAFFEEPVRPIGGHIVAHTSHTRIYLRKARRGPVRIARLVSSPYLPEGECVFRITENGIEDVEEDRES